MSDISKNIYVYADWPELQAPALMGCLNTQFIRGKEIFSFEFDSEWLKSKSAQILDPDLQFYSGRQYTDSGKNTFGLFLDSSPDRWGRQLMRRREAIKARHDDRPVRQLLESDYLLGVHDVTRMGALRFKLNESEDFQNHDFELPAPPWTSLRELEAACRHYEEESPSDSEHEKWLSMLLAPGSSLGGARPKANVLDNDGNLWIAKFPSRADDANTGAWEMVVHELAKKIGLNVPECRIEKFSKYGNTFLTKRFDRKIEKRIHFASAMTLLGRSDGDNHSSGCSYLDLAQFIVQHGARPNEDLQELWRRIIFSIAVSNTDDHLRNHGFLLIPQGWTLSPAYDINPNPRGSSLSLNISMDDNSLDFELALSVAEQFRLNISQAKEQLNDIKYIVNHWREIASKFKISRHEIENMTLAFRD
ncbi:MAG: type II toxin-antitoxin system HipA family toxin [Victivallaceae bacterium]|nr:type II toxin-antitoxin system HipA family toxin [Victivallaceae bacterium]